MFCSAPCMHSLLALMRLIVAAAGWLNVLGQFAATAGAGSLVAQHIAAMWAMSDGYHFFQRDLFLAYARACSPKWRPTALYACTCEPALDIL